MAVFGVTGHTNLTHGSTELVRRAVINLLRPHAGDLVGMTCLARGADQTFADAVLELGGALQIVVPATDYFTSITDPVSRERCQAYLGAARSTVTMSYEISGPAAYLCASKWVIDHCDVLVAVWDGSPPTGSGGTADAVEYARDRGRTIHVVWPEGARRS